MDNPHVAKVLDGPAVRQVVGGQRVYYLEPYYEGGTATKHLGDPWDATRSDPQSAGGARPEVKFGLRVLLPCQRGWWGLNAHAGPRWST